MSKRTYDYGELCNNYKILKRALQERYLCAGNYNTPAPILYMLSKDKNTKIRQAVAKNPFTPNLGNLATDRQDEVRSSVARNLGANASVLEQLSSDLSKDVRFGVATHDKTPINVLHKLATDNESLVRMGVAGNRATSVATLKLLISDQNEGVVKSAIASLNRWYPDQLTEFQRFEIAKQNLRQQLWELEIFSSCQANRQCLDFFAINEKEDK